MDKCSNDFKAGKQSTASCLSYMNCNPKGRLTLQQWCVRVIFNESESSQSHKPFEAESSQSHLKFFRIESESSHDLVESSQSRVTRIVEWLQVIGLQAGVNVESHDISHFFYDIVLQWNGAQNGIQYHPIS